MWPGMKYQGRKDGRYLKLLIALLILAIGIIPAGCGQGLSNTTLFANSAPFYRDRVVKVRIEMSVDDWQNMLRQATAEEYVKADFWYDGKLLPDVAVRPKGNSSLMSVVASRSPRLSLKVDLNFFNDARHLNGVKKLNFNNGFSDPTLIREALSYDLFKQTGIPTPRYSFIDLWINDIRLGVYTMVEQIDKAFLAEHFRHNNGNLYKPELPGGRLSWTEADMISATASKGSTVKLDEVNLGGGKLSEILKALEQPETLPAKPAPAPALINPGGALPGGRVVFPGMGVQRGLLESMGLKTNENNNNHQALWRFLEVLNKEPAATFQKEIEKVLDVDGALKYIAVSTILVHLDNYSGQFAHNYYLYEVNGKFSILPWDMNMSFGGFNNELDRQRIINFYIDEPTAGVTAERPLISRLLAVPAYLERYHGYLAELTAGPFSPAVMNAKIDAKANLIRPFVKTDTLKFYSTADFEKALREDMVAVVRSPGMGPTIGLQVFAAQRGESIKKQLAGILPSKSTDGTGNGSRGMFGFPGNLQNPANPRIQLPVLPQNPAKP